MIGLVPENDFGIGHTQPGAFTMWFGRVDSKLIKGRDGQVRLTRSMIANRVVPAQGSRTQQLPPQVDL